MLKWMCCLLYLQGVLTGFHGPMCQVGQGGPSPHDWVVGGAGPSES